MSAASEPVFTDSFENYANSGLVTVNFHKTITALEANVNSLRESSAATAASLADVHAQLARLTTAVEALDSQPTWTSMTLAVVAPLTAYLLLDRFILRR